MGVVWHGRALYTGPFGSVLWLREPNRPAGNFVAMYTAAYLRFFPTQINNPDLDLSTPDPNPGWSAFGDLRVMAWNGGKADAP